MHFGEGGDASVLGRTGPALSSHVIYWELFTIVSLKFKYEDHLRA
jgi:hypothetical protein